MPETRKLLARMSIEMRAMQDSLEITEAINRAMASERDVFLAEINRQKARIDELLADNTKQIEKRRAADREANAALEERDYATKAANLYANKAMVAAMSIQLYADKAAQLEERVAQLESEVDNGARDGSA